MRPSHAVIALLVVVLFVPAFAPAPAAAPPPEAVCGLCGSAFEDAADEAGVETEIRESKLVVRLDEDGHSHWTAFVSVNPGAADQFAANRSLLDRAVRQTLDSHRTVVDDPRDLQVAVDGQRVTVTFEVADAAHRRPGGVLLFDTFTQEQSEGEAYVDADRLVVRGPDGWTVTHTPPGGEIEGDRVVWTGRSTDSRYVSNLGRHAAIAFTPGSTGLPAKVVTALAIRMHTLEQVGPELRAFAQAPAVLFALVALGLLLAGERIEFAGSGGRRPVTWLVAAAGVLAAVVLGAALVGADDLAFVLGGVAIGLAPSAVLTSALLVLAGHLDRRPVAGERTTTVALLAAITWPVVLVLGAPGSAVLVLLLGPLAFLPFGVLAGVGHPGRLLFPAVAALGPVVAALPFVPRIGVVFVTTAMFTALLAGTAVFGVTLFALGRQLGTEARPSRGERGTETSASG
ncbi:hypothetical protein [Haloarchaeobius sp. DT45]|uniref:hypothetical protein n=1 Tax=Haloarchaeobius sp. DT45 TaxID=3446116 RepID=UPI003F6B840D